MCKVIGHACVAILLTTTTKRTTPMTHGLWNTSDRAVWYERSLSLWNQDEESRKAVVVVQNSPPFTTYEHLEMIRFTHTKRHEKTYCGKVTTAMGEHELISIQKALEQSRILKNATHVVKVTGRYYIPSIFKFLNVLPTTKIIHMNGFAGGCQIMGCRKDVCPQLWRCPYDKFHHCEATIKHRMHAHPVSERHSLPVLHTAFTLSGSGKEPVTYLPP
jgi:hypothetical protein